MTQIIIHTVHIISQNTLQGVRMMARMCIIAIECELLNYPFTLYIAEILIYNTYRYTDTLAFSNVSATYYSLTFEASLIYIVPVV